jgi:hypothetical protein
VPVVLELADQQGPFGARGVAEMPLVPFLPAVASAIHDAVGVWLTEQPFTPERVLASIAGAPHTLSLGNDRSLPERERSLEPTVRDHRGNL